MTNLDNPDFQTPLPTYPELPQLVRVTNRAIVGNVYPAITQQYAGNLTFRDREPCYVIEPNGVILSASIYDCRLVGSYLDLPLYATTCCVAGVAPGNSSSSGGS